MNDATEDLEHLQREVRRLRAEEQRLYQASIRCYGSPEYDQAIDEFYACGRRVRAAERRVMIAQYTKDEGLALTNE